MCYSLYFFLYIIYATTGEQYAELTYLTLLNRVLSEQMPCSSHVGIIVFTRRVHMNATTMM